MTNQATRIVVKAVGELCIPSETAQDNAVDFQAAAEDLEAEEERMEDFLNNQTVGEEEVQGQIDYETYRPKVVGEEWILSEMDLCKLMLYLTCSLLSECRIVFIMEGCGVLGTVCPSPLLASTQNL